MNEIVLMYQYDSMIWVLFKQGSVIGKEMGSSYENVIDYHNTLSFVMSFYVAIIIYIV